MMLWDARRKPRVEFLIELHDPFGVVIARANVKVAAEVMGDGPVGVMAWTGLYRHAYPLNEHVVPFVTVDEVNVIGRAAWRGVRRRRACRGGS